MPRGASSWELGGPAERAASAIKVAEWIEWTFIGYAGEHRPVISAPPDELLAALDHLEGFIDGRFHDLGVKQACSGGARRDAVKVIVAVPVENVDEVQQLVESRTTCEELRREIGAQVALGWTLDRDRAQPAAAGGRGRAGLLRQGAAGRSDALRLAAGSSATAESCADLIVAPRIGLTGTRTTRGWTHVGVPREGVLEQLVSSGRWPPRSC